MSLSEHYSFEDLTVTLNDSLQKANREAALLYRPTLLALSGLLETLRAGLPPVESSGLLDLFVNSAFRSATLNKATPGSSPTSQHPMGQAADIHRPGEDPGKTFTLVLALLKAKQIPFGQLIDESAQRGYRISRWVHISLGPSFWKPERCGEVLKKWDENGQPQYKMLEKVPVLTFPSSDV